MEFKKKSELADEFRVVFNSLKTEIEKDIEELHQTPVADLKEKVTAISLKVQDLKIKLQEATKILPAYTAKCRQEDIKVLEESLKETETELIPKPKFSFKTKIEKPKSSAEKKSSEPTKEAIQVLTDVVSTRNDPNFLTIQNDSLESGVMDNTMFIFEEDKLNKIDVMVRDLDGKDICLYGSPSTLHLSNLTNCRLLCGPVQTSVFVDNCKNSKLYLCCQQLRTHNSTELDIYLRVSSRGIIENCTKIRFGPYQWNHPNSTALHKLANIDENLERYNAIDDFNWLAFTTPSPNWSIVPEAEREYFPSK